MSDAAAPPSILERLGLHRKELRAWAMYDWANSAFMTTIIAAVFPIYYASVAAADLPPSTAAARFAWATTMALLFVAFDIEVIFIYLWAIVFRDLLLGGFVSMLIFVLIRIVPGDVVELRMADQVAGLFGQRRVDGQVVDVRQHVGDAGRGLEA